MEEKAFKKFITKNKSGKIYTHRLKFLMKSKIIYWMECDCKDFQYRRIKSFRNLCDKTFYATPCKHLKPIIEMYNRDYGFQLKKPKNMKGENKPTAQLRNILIKRSDGLCEFNCGRIGRHIHRKIRSSNGGKYSEENCILLCEECHKMVHFKEFDSNFI